jgi:hypothetical protein
MYATPDGNVAQIIIKMIGQAAWGLGPGFEGCKNVEKYKQVKIRCKFPEYSKSDCGSKRAASPVVITMMNMRV